MEFQAFRLIKYAQWLRTHELNNKYWPGSSYLVKGVNLPRCTQRKLAHQYRVSSSLST